jgi:hypothetical protein
VFLEAAWPVERAIAAVYIAVVEVRALDEAIVVYRSVGEFSIRSRGIFVFRVVAGVIECLDGF